jgi:hypothetical protein
MVGSVGPRWRLADVARRPFGQQRSASALRATIAVIGVGGTLAVSAVVVAGPRDGSAADPFVAGQQAVDVAALTGPAAEAGFARAAASRLRLGFPTPARQEASHVVDRFAATTYDEVTAFDGFGRMVSLQRFDTAGRLTAAVRFGWSSGGGAPLPDGTAARARAESLVTATLGAPPSGLVRVGRTGADGGWTVGWTRSVAGIQVPGDGVRVQLWADGSLHSFSRSERRLAPAPAVTLDRATVRGLLDGQLDRWFAGAQRSEVTVTGLDLAWVAPNDTFAPGRPDAPAATLRLAWVGRIATTATLAESLRGLEVYLDAGDGSVLGGDVLR